jgi:serine/threonine-protein kinase HipA
VGSARHPATPPRGDSRDVDTAALPTITYLLESGTDRIGANDFQASAETYVPRETNATLEELLTAADRLQAGEPFSEADRPGPQRRLVGRGCPPKGDRHRRRRSRADREVLHPDRHLPGRQGRAVAMELARRADLNVAATERVTVLDRDVLLVDRFDRIPGTHRRRALVSALTLLGLGEMYARYATYPDLAQTIRIPLHRPARATLVELLAGWSSTS